MPKIPSIHCLTSFAAAGVYLSRRSLRRSLSNDDTDAIEGDFRSSGVIVWSAAVLVQVEERKRLVRLQLRQSRGSGSTDSWRVALKTVCGENS